MEITSLIKKNLSKFVVSVCLCPVKEGLIGAAPFLMLESMSVSKKLMTTKRERNTNESLLSPL